MRGKATFVLGASITLALAGVGGALLVRSHLHACDDAYVAFSGWTAANGAAPPPGQMPTCTSWYSMYPAMLATFLVGLVGAIASGLALWTIRSPAARATP